MLCLIGKRAGDQQRKADKHSAASTPTIKKDPAD